MSVAMRPDAVLAELGFVVTDAGWIAGRRKVESLVAAILGTSLGAELRAAGVQGATEPAASLAEAQALVATGRPQVYSLTRAPGDGLVAVTMTLATTGFTLHVRCNDSALVARSATVLEDLLEVAFAVRRAEVAAGLRYGFVEPIVRRLAGYDYPRPRPPRRHAKLAVGAVLDLVDPAFHRAVASDEQAGALAMAAGPLPASARREEREGLVLVRWVDSLEDEAALARACAAHEEWLGQVSTTTIDGNYTELGDEREPMRGLEVRPSMVHYHPQTKRAYVALVVLPSGEPEQGAWNEALERSRLRVTAKGEPISQVRLVVPLRAHALALSSRAAAAGLGPVLYPAADGAWLCPDPPGSWAYPPRSS